MILMTVPCPVPQQTSHVPHTSLVLFSPFSHSYNAVLESLLIGHEDWVHSCKWQPHGRAAAGSGSAAGCGGVVVPDRRDLCLLTTSMDRTMVLWVYEVGVIDKQCVWGVKSVQCHSLITVLCQHQLAMQ